jgi:hypothetical protein
LFERWRAILGLRGRRVRGAVRTAEGRWVGEDDKLYDRTGTSDEIKIG